MSSKKNHAFPKNPFTVAGQCRTQTGLSLLCAAHPGNRHTSNDEVIKI